MQENGDDRTQAIYMSSIATIRGLHNNHWHLMARPCDKINEEVMTRAGMDLQSVSWHGARRLREEQADVGPKTCRYTPALGLYNILYWTATPDTRAHAFRSGNYVLRGMQDQKQSVALSRIRWETTAPHIDQSPANVTLVYTWKPNAFTARGL